MEDSPVILGPEPKTLAIGAKNTKMSKSSTKGASAVRGDERFENVTVPDDVQRGDLCQLVVECGDMLTMSAHHARAPVEGVCQLCCYLSCIAALWHVLAVRLNLVLSSSVV